MAQEGIGCCIMVWKLAKIKLEGGGIKVLIGYWSPETKHEMTIYFEYVFKLIALNYTLILYSLAIILRHIIIHLNVCIHEISTYNSITLAIQSVHMHHFCEKTDE